MHSCRPVLDTGAGIILVRPNVLPASWQTYAEKLERTPRIKDANNNHLIANYAIHLYIDVGCAKVLDRLFVAEHLSVPCTLGTEFMDNQVEAIFTRLKKVMWQDHVGDVTRNSRRTPVLATLLANKWERSWEDQPAEVRACRQVRVKGRMEEWIWRPATPLASSPSRPTSAYAGTSQWQSPVALYLSFPMNHFWLRSATSDRTKP